MTEKKRVQSILFRSLEPFISNADERLQTAIALYEQHSGKTTQEIVEVWLDENRHSKENHIRFKKQKVANTMRASISALLAGCEEYNVE